MSGNQFKSVINKLQSFIKGIIGLDLYRIDVYSTTNLGLSLISRKKRSDGGAMSFHIYLYVCTGILSDKQYFKKFIKNVIVR